VVDNLWQIAVEDRIDQRFPLCSPRGQVDLGLLQTVELEAAQLFADLHVLVVHPGPNPAVEPDVHERQKPPQRIHGFNQTQLKPWLETCRGRSDGKPRIVSTIRKEQFQPWSFVPGGDRTYPHLDCITVGDRLGKEERGAASHRMRRPADNRCDPCCSLLFLEPGIARAVGGRSFVVLGPAVGRIPPNMRRQRADELLQFTT
jgi:hypothetical protein